MTDDAATPLRTLPVAAFFDVDKTLVNGASLLFLARAARSLGIVTWRDLARFGWKAVSFRRHGETLSVLDEVRDRGMQLLAGQRADRLHALAAKVVETMRPRIWPETRDLLRAHLDAGHEVYLISATPDFLAQELAASLGATAGIGSGLEIEDGVFTGRFTSGTMHGPEKARAAQVLMADRGFDPVDCYAYSDSSNDLPLLTAVGTPVAVNPDRGLDRHARAEGWRVLELDPASIRAERKRVRAASRRRTA
ncbi:HAD family hydrolase [Amnibacterium setariae]|jgi:HAD superfamily hydrolase (TIGR01490 family)|uniref:HAD-IB family hydrolase n=1 Tax=Amnibacterium setariae TaxID=2306585 RepID=A0A3A1TZ44_9MICO|nr:HAD-IB family hydrolase [Amnibacterium setariae]RIX29924.1 HAD-IB family hydrolase [Amnibacterium setariae]